MAKNTNRVACLIAYVAALGLAIALRRFTGRCTSTTQ